MSFKRTLSLFCFLCVCCTLFGQAELRVDRYKATFSEFPKHVPTDKTVDAPITGNGDIGLTMAPSDGKIVFYVGKNDFWKAVASIPDGKIALPGGLTIQSDFFKENYYTAEQKPGTAELQATFKNNKNELKITAWVPALENKVIIEVESSAKTKLKLNLWTQDGSESVTDGGVEKGRAWVHRSFDNLPYLQWPTYMAMAMNYQNGEIVLQPGKKETIVVAIYTNHDTEQWLEKALEGVAKVTADAIEKTRQEHRDWWNGFWGLSSVSFGDEFLEKYYYQSQYIFACASREGKFAPGLWGPFITSDEPAWRGDYHLNYNYEEPYWARFTSNHICLTENYDQPMLDYMEQGYKHAKNLFGCRGILYPVGLGPKGLCSSAWPKNQARMKSGYGFEDNTIEDGVAFWQQKTNASFVAANMMMHFYSTYDKEYARKIYPFVKACAEFWEDYMDYEDGRYVIRGDVFNETMPWKNYEGDFNCALSLGMAKMVFRSVEDLSRFLKVDGGKRNKWKRIRERISDYPLAINSRGNVSMTYREKEGQKASGTDQILMHGLSLPTGMTGPNLTPEYNEIMLRDLYGWYPHNEMDWGNTMNNGAGTVYTSAARIGFPAEMLLKNLKERIKMGSYPNCYIVAGGGGIETTSAVPGTINEMMMQSYEGILRIFPNWDRKINASFEYLRAYGAFLVSSSIEKGKIGFVIVKSEKGRPCRIENPWPGETVVVNRNGRRWKVFDGKVFYFKTRVGDMFEIKKIEK